MPTAASGALLLRAQPTPQKHPKLSLLKALHSPRCAEIEEVPGISVTPRGENHWVADKPREFIETIATPRAFQSDVEPR